jgi:hypothetical protein
MFDPESIPKNIPPLGFYYHKKHDPVAGVQDKAYELVGVGYHTETGEHTALYRPLYKEAWGYQNGKLIYMRPLEMFMDSEEKEGMELKRFSLIEDTALIAQFTAIRTEMY